MSRFSKFISLTCKFKVFIHCNAGISRSATFVVAYLMKTQKMTMREAMDYCRKTRSEFVRLCVAVFAQSSSYSYPQLDFSGIRPNTGFAEQLKEYESILGSKI